MFLLIIILRLSSTNRTNIFQGIIIMIHKQKHMNYEENQYSLNYFLEHIFGTTYLLFSDERFLIWNRDWQELP